MDPNVNLEQAGNEPVAEQAGASGLDIDKLVADVTAELAKADASASSAAGAAPAGEGAAPKAAQAAVGAPAQERISRVQQRIDSLVGARKEADERATLLATQLEQLRAQNQALAQQVAAMRGGQPAAGAAASVTPKQGEAAAGEDPVTLAVNKALGPIMARFQEGEKQSRAQALFDAQGRSFAEAAMVLPELKVQGSELCTTAREIFDRDPYLKGHPRGPYFAAMAAAGILRDTQGGAETPARKVAAAVPSGGAGAGVASKPDQLAVLEAQRASVLAAMRDGGDPEKLWPLNRQLQMKIADLSAQRAIKI